MGDDSHARDADLANQLHLNVANSVLSVLHTAQSLAQGGPFHPHEFGCLFTGDTLLEAAVGRPRGRVLSAARGVHRSCRGRRAPCSNRGDDRRFCKRKMRGDKVGRFQTGAADADASDGPVDEAAERFGGDCRAVVLPSADPLGW